MKEKEIRKRLEQLGKDVIEDINKKKNPDIDIPVRSLSNVVYDEKTKMLKLGNKVSKRYFFNVSHAKPFMQTLMVAAFCKELADEGIHTSLRDLFYALKRTLPNSDENTFDEQTESDPVIVDLEVALDVLREQLNLGADVRGRAVGNVKIKDRGDTVDWSKLGSGGWAIPSNVEEIEIKNVDADFILCLPEYEEVVVKVNGMVRTMDIKEVYRRHKAGEEIQVIGYDDDLNPTFCKIDLVTKRKARPNEKLIRMETRSGSNVFVSEKHKIPILTKNGILNKPAEDIKENEIVLEAKDMAGVANNFDNLNLDLIDFIANYHPEKTEKIRVCGDYVKELLEDAKVDWWSKKEGGIYQELVNAWKGRRSLPLSYYLKFEKSKDNRRGLKLFLQGDPKRSAVPAVLRVDKKISRLFGYYVAVGHVYNNMPFFTLGKHETELIGDVIKLIGDVFGIKPRAYKEGENYSSIQIMCGNKILGMLFEFLCGKGAANKKVPHIIFNLKEDVKISFLEGYFNGDGTIYEEGISCSTISERLANELRLLFRFLGVPSYKKTVKTRGFEGYVSKPLHVVDVLLKHWENKNLKKSHSLWDRAPIFLFDGGEKALKQRLGYKSLNIHASSVRLNTKYIHPVRLRKVENLDYDGDYYEIVSCSPSHVFLHAGGVFTHNCIEKNAMFERLHEDKFWKKMNCVLITTQGQAARGVRRMIQRLSNEFKLPVYVFCDLDAYGLYIYSVIKYGSISLAHVSEKLGTSNAKFLGLTMDDIDEFGLHNFTIKAKDVDIKRAQEMLKYDWFQSKDWQKLLKSLVQRKIKAELEALSGKGLRFVTETYLPRKIKNKEFLD